MNLGDPRPKPFDLLAELAKFGVERQISLRDPQATSAFTDFVGEALSGALSDPVLLYGQRTQAMFEALVVSLGGYSLLKAEDTGPVYPKERFRVPDFRVVLSDGTQWLVEVKNVYIEDASRQERLLMTRTYREKLENYATATGATLKLAVFWAKWGIWTLVSPERLVDGDGCLTLDMLSALRTNELGSLGDRMIGTRPPLRLRLTTEPERTSPIALDGKVCFTISSVQIFCGKDEILDPVEQQIAWIFLEYGEWDAAGPHALQEGNQLKAIEFQWEPVERRNEGFETIGTLSRMFARYYTERTVENRKVVQLLAPARPSWFAPLIKSDYKSKALPLWQFIQQPNITNI